MEMGYLIVLLFYFIFVFFFVMETKVRGNALALVAINPFLFLFYQRFLKEKISFLMLILLRKKSIKKLNNEIPQLLEHMLTCLKAGLQPMNALEYIFLKYTWSEIIHGLLERILNANKGGLSFCISLEQGISYLKNTGVEAKSLRYLRLFISSLIMAHSMGGDYISIISRLKEKLTNAFELERKITVTTAQMRIQSLVIAFAPLAIALILWVIVPEQILFFFQENSGRFLLMTMIVLNIVGYYFLKELSNLDDLL